MALRTSEQNGAVPTQGRRQFIKEAAALVLSAVALLTPLLAGLRVFLDPIRRRSQGALSLRITSLAALPEDGAPRKFAVVTTRVDAWTKTPQVPVGAVYLRRVSGEKVQALNVACPHAGCFVGYAEERKISQCPCHTSAFELDGSIIAPSPSPRAMVELEVDQEQLKETGDVMIRFLNYLPGHADQVAK